MMNKVKVHPQILMDKINHRTLHLNKEKNYKKDLLK
jgi:hypothetical protein